MNAGASGSGSSSGAGRAATGIASCSAGEPSSAASALINGRPWRSAARRPCWSPSLAISSASSGSCWRNWSSSAVPRRGSKRYGDRRTGDGDDGDRGLRRFRQHHTDARIAAETGLAQLPACLLDHLLQAAVIQRCVARGEHGGLLRYAARQLGERRVQGGGLGADRVGVGRRESRPRLGHGGVEVVVHGCLSWLGSGLAMARIADLRQHPSKSCRLLSNKTLPLAAQFANLPSSPIPTAPPEA